ncbi:LysE family transporter [Clostridium estertheticum]|uniref:Lysine transporter LysE n=1 Tax=Clostridium estertheticum TaxID=238834 RepID=A0A5N7IUZ0_9CLOT|nr:LysE family transporter [Clostridium estertheticum]MBX4268468.1 LysE family transporter [Clostridium estertheticum]MPQ34126.1 lysine transporter LysE [Clostridium estertheticum]MPQ64728.1 lysine transporter LysE [Clostridium estertheticum]WLC81472.1 LysE family transporter [Clostridium estertheticum]
MNNSVAFLTYTLLTAFTPGPNNILAMSNTSKHGLKKSIGLIQGIFVGLLSVMILCSFFSVMLVNIIPTIKPAMTYIGAAYILWLAWHIVKSKPGENAGNVEKADSFMTGFFLQFVNIKIILYGITAISTFITPYYSSFFSIGGFTLLITVCGCAGTFTWAIFGAVFQNFFEKYSIIVNIIMALLLVYCAITLII